MMFWFQLAVVVVLLIAVGWIAVGGGGHMSPPVPDRPDPAVPETGLLGRGDVDKVRFSVGARGYRMDEVDDVLDRLAHEIDVRERRIAQLEGRPLPEESGEAPAFAPAEQLPPMPQRTAEAPQEPEQFQPLEPAHPVEAISSLTQQEPAAQPESAAPETTAAEEPGPSEEA
jgi:DivIVA domain-containing protein